MTGLWIPHQFRNPRAQLHPYLRECVRDLEKHGVCRISGDLITDRGICMPEQLEMFREACRNVSNELDQNLIIDTEMLAKPGDADSLLEGKPGDLLVMLAPKNAPGTMPDEKRVVDDPDDGGVLTTEENPKRQKLITV